MGARLLGALLAAAAHGAAASSHRLRSSWFHSQAGTLSVDTKDAVALVEDMGTTWSKCALEGGRCECPSFVVRYGQGKRWVVSKFDSSLASLECSSKSFGNLDPESGVKKECWCQKSQQSAESQKVAIVMLTRHPANLKTWLRYHLGFAGVDHVFMSIEDSPELNSTLHELPSSLREKVTSWWSSPSANGPDARPKDDYSTLQARQMAVMERAREMSVQMGISWLFHVDDDELLFSPAHRKIGDILAAMPKGYDQALVPNVEAVYPSAAVKNCFTETKEVNMNRYLFASYANGKSGVRVTNPKARPAGPHAWMTAEGTALPSISLKEEPFGPPLMVVHFESCPFSRWEDKFWELGNTTPDKINAIPFRFYQESITKMQGCRSSSNGTQLLETAGCSKADLVQLWESWKTGKNPHLQPKDVMPLRIPWTDILAQTVKEL